MKRFLYCVFICIFFFPIFVKADDCSSVDRERLKKFANNVTFTLEEVDYNGNIYFKMLFVGVSKEISIFDQNTYLSHRNLSNDFISEVDIGFLKSGKSSIYRIRGNNVCSNYTFRTITVNVPKYNIYYNEPICSNARNYKLCQKWYDNSDLTYEQFKEKVKKYISENNSIKNENIVNNDDKNDAYLIFLEIYEKYYLITLLSLIIILSVLIYLWIKQNKKNKL